MPHLLADAQLALGRRLLPAPRVIGRLRVTGPTRTPRVRRGDRAGARVVDHSERATSSTS